MLLEYICPNTGQMLSSTWEKHRNDPLRRQKLFQGMARLILHGGQHVTGMQHQDKHIVSLYGNRWSLVRCEKSCL
ncbi:hypothetical protein F5882DRAFT_397391 [Hyaloscypha sp. PMI_1271]|nr:hypothetical protein F5882DRAFT_397391 [Hyaloscypha sp. PMI_1271]